MSKLTKEILISKGVKFVVEKGETFFGVGSLKKKVKGVKFKKGDILEKEIDGNSLQVIRAEDITEWESVEPAVETIAPEEIEVIEPEFVPCGEGCGCLMTQEEAEECQKNCEKK